jgi:hypothetical protein
MTILIGVAYFLVGWLSTLPATHVQAWRFAAWIISALVYAAQIGYEHFTLRTAPLKLALRAGLASAIGGFGIAAAAIVHDVMTRPSMRPMMFIALIAWPLLTGVPAFVIAWVAAFALSRTRTS